MDFAFRLRWIGFFDMKTATTSHSFKGSRIYFLLSFYTVKHMIFVEYIVVLSSTYVRRCIYIRLNIFGPQSFSEHRARPAPQAICKMGISNQQKFDHKSPELAMTM